MPCLKAQAAPSPQTCAEASVGGSDEATTYCRGARPAPEFGLPQAQDRLSVWTYQRGRDFAFPMLQSIALVSKPTNQWAGARAERERERERVPTIGRGSNAPSYKHKGSKPRHQKSRCTPKLKRFCRGLNPRPSACRERERERVPTIGRGSNAPALLINAKEAQAHQKPVHSKTQKVLSGIEPETFCV